jgi:CDGSH-type Zn-finger protein
MGHNGRTAQEPRVSEPVQITVIPDGPLKISGAGEVRFCGERIAAGDDVYLCRCGDSTNAPFCDGTHTKMGFSGAAEVTPDKEIRVWEGKTLRTHFNPNACMHVYLCKPLNDLRAAELEGDTAAATEIMRVVGTCPSGALSYELKADVPEPAEPTLPAIEIMEGGEVRVQVDFEINAPLFERQADDRATLCRCGKSKSKPWCDGRHKGRKGFR